MTAEFRLAQEIAQRRWRSLIEENTHSGNLGHNQAFGCMIENRAHLLDGDAWKQFHKLGDFNPVFEVLEESRDRDARAAKHPRAAYALRITFYGWARRPI